jgi:hypothetical protein
VGSNLAPQFTRHLDDLFPTLEELVNAAEAAQALVATPGWACLSALLHAEVATIDAELDSGRPLESRADYAARHGRRGGLMAPERALQALVGRAESRLAEQRAKHEGDAESSPDRSTAR